MTRSADLLATGWNRYQSGDFAQAEELFRQATGGDPGSAVAWCYLGLACYALSRFQEAVQCYRRSLGLQPNLAQTHNNLGNALLALGRHGEAAAALEQAVRLMGAEPTFHRNLGVVLLTLGDFARGWTEYEWRFKCPDVEPVGSADKRWDGSAMPGRTILLYAEQGLGDAIQFVRYAPLVKQRCGSVLVQCPAALLRLLSAAPGIDRLIPRDSPLPAFDADLPLMSLPAALGPTLEPLSSAVPYVVPDEQFVESWRGVLGPIRGLKVGVAWQGNPNMPLDRLRSFPLACLAPLAAVGGVRLISLQKGPGCEQIAALGGRFPIVDFAGRLDEQAGAFMDTAAIMKSLDLVVTADTVTAHLAGAMGVPVWLVLAYNADWRWLTGRDDTPWYPTMRLFRQPAPGDWDGAFARVAEALAGRAAAAAPADRPAPPPAIAAEISAGELLDKIAILQIKARRIAEPGKLGNVLVELAVLTATRGRTVSDSPRLAELTAELERANESLWQVEDDIRTCERVGDFGPRFVELARSVYQQNDRRAALKRAINELVGSALVEEKSYAPYGATGREPGKMGTGTEAANNMSLRSQSPFPDLPVAATPLDTRAVLQCGPVRLKRCRHGAMLYLAGDEYIGRSLDRYGEFSEREMEVFQQLVRPGQVALDVGANIGTHAVCLARIIGPGGTVLAFEPQRFLFQVLCANVALNALTNVRTIHAAVGRQAGTVFVPVPDYSAPLNFGGISLSAVTAAAGGGARGAGGEPVPVLAIDSLGLPACHFVKIDVEGMESDVLAGAEQTLRRYRPMLYIENDRERESPALIQRLLSLDYRLYWHLPRMFNSRNYFHQQENVFGSVVSVNMLGLHRSVTQAINGLREITSPEDSWRK